MNTSSYSPLFVLSEKENEERHSVFQIYDNDLGEDSQEWKDTKARLESYLPRYRALWLAHHQEKQEVINVDVTGENLDNAYEADDEMVICCDKQKCTCGLLSFVPHEFLEIQIENQANVEVLSEPEWEDDNKNDDKSEASSTADTDSSGDSTCVPFDVSWLPSPTGSAITSHDHKIDNVPKQLPVKEKVDVLEILDSSLSEDDGDKENDNARTQMKFKRRPEIIVIDSDDDVAPISKASKHASNKQQNHLMMNKSGSVGNGRNSSPLEAEIKTNARKIAEKGTKRSRRLVIESSDEEMTQSESEGMLNSTFAKLSEKNRMVLDSDEKGRDDEHESRVDDLLGKIKSLTLRNKIQSDSGLPRTTKKTNAIVVFDLVDSDDDNDQDDSMDATSGKWKAKVGKVPPGKKKTKIRRNSFIVDSNDDEYSDECDDFSSIDDIDSPVALRKDTGSKSNECNNKVSKALFRRTREQLSQTLFAEFDKKVFDGKLASNTKVVWSNKLRTTAGLTRLKALRQGSEIISRSAVVELSTKVLEDSQRLRATLMHELCHAAQWLEDGVSKPPHGDVFKKWAKTATRRIPDIPVTVKHDYEISFKYTWKCVQCHGLLKRHSRSVDVDKHVCGRCRGRLVEVESDGTQKSSPTKRSRVPSAYNQFIKDNSSQVRRELEKSQSEKVTQAQVLKQCARLWREQTNT